MKIEQESKDALLAAAARAHNGLAEFSVGVDEILKAYRVMVGQAHEAGKAAGVSAAAGPVSRLQSVIGPDRIYEAIRGAMNAQGFSPLFKATAMRGSDDRNVVPDLVDHFETLLRAL